MKSTCRRIYKSTNLQIYKSTCRRIYKSTNLHVDASTNLHVDFKPELIKKPVVKPFFLWNDTDSCKQKASLHAKKSDNKGYQILDATDPPVRSASIKHREQHRKKIQKITLYDVKKFTLRWGLFLMHWN